MSRLRSLDSLRGAAALAVVVYHALNAGPGPGPDVRWHAWAVTLAQLGRLPVTVFFVLSGFLVHARWAHQRAQGQDLHIVPGELWRRRFLRIYPPYVVALA